jgi:Mn-dependent DtxR family transcriptional regulator
MRGFSTTELSFYVTQIMNYIEDYPVRHVGDIQAALNIPNKEFDSAINFLVKNGLIEVDEGVVQ